MVSIPPKIALEPINLVTQGFKDYGLIDCGHGRKLEQYGPYLVIRPEPQCVWSPLYPELWTKADATFDPETEDDDGGRWSFSRPIDDSFPLSFGALRFHGRFTAFRHLAFFPEQAANWHWQTSVLAEMQGAHILNLFGYTGVATLNAAAAGARVTHLDASKKAIGWARENAALSGLSEAPIRWICDDARKYVQREIKRGTRYDGIILDPPKYGRGPTGEVWRLFEDLKEMMNMCAELLSPDARFLLLNAYAARLSGPALAHGLAQALHKHDIKGGQIDYGELTLKQNPTPPTGFDVSPLEHREIGLSFYARWLR
jgi:23S rRNA (cytosine1962-C5)-methyltransferase